VAHGNSSGHPRWWRLHCLGETGGTRLAGKGTGRYRGDGCCGNKHTMVTWNENHLAVLHGKL